MNLADLPRLAGTITLAGNAFDVRAVGTVAEDNHSYIQVKVSGAVWLTCQRCLEAVEHVVDHNVLFQLWWPAGAVLPDEELFEDGFDALLAGNELDLAQLVEDEVLLGLPISPRHADCRLPESASGVTEILPFDVLKGLKRRQ